MGNIITYLKWRGDLNFSERPFCLVDNLVLSAFAYQNLSGIVNDDKEPVTVAEAYTRYQEKNPDEKEKTALFSLMARSRRFGQANLSYYREVYDAETASQFTAVHITLDDESRYIAFRGTDNTIIGWQEDFGIGSMVVPAQLMAKDYLERTMEEGKHYRIGGHSKGGNLAIFSAAQSEEKLQDQIIEVYNNDGPGLSADIIPKERLAAIREKVCWIVPEFSIIGTLFPCGMPDRILGSDADGLMQHDIYTWQIEGDTVCEKETLTKNCRFYVQIFNTWITSATLEQRKTFTKDFFDALKAGGAATMDEVWGGGLDGFGTILLSIIHSERKTKIVIAKFIHSFISNCKNIDFKEAVRSREILQAGLLFSAGLIFIIFPEAALRLVGRFLGMAVIVFSGRKMLQCAVNDGIDKKQKGHRILSWLAAICVMEFFVVNKSAILLSTHFLLGILLILFSFRNFYQAITVYRNLPVRFGMFLVSAAAILMGIISLSQVQTESAVVFTIGSFLVIYSVALIFKELYNNGKQKMK